MNTETIALITSPMNYESPVLQELGSVKDITQYTVSVIVE